MAGARELWRNCDGHAMLKSGTWTRARVGLQFGIRTLRGGKVILKFSDEFRY